MENKLALNISNTQYIDFSEEAHNNNNLTIHNYSCKNTYNNSNFCNCSHLENVEEYKYLGCIFLKLINPSLPLILQ